MAGDNVPARPGELERPVPRVRVVTRLGIMKEEQVIPAKEEHGSEAVKSQLVKNALGELEVMSVRLFLISRRADKSTALIIPCVSTTIERRTRGNNKRSIFIAIFFLVLSSLSFGSFLF